jgi:RNA polymerase sigma factor (sigma-70 family)
MLHVARDVFPVHDEAMDAYAFVLDRLREQDFRRLRGFADDGLSKVTTWLTVVTRRLCLDFYRQQYGRARSAQDQAAATERLSARRRLVRLAGSDEVLIEQALDTTRPLPDTSLQQRELREAVAHAMSQLSSEERLLIKLRFQDGLSGNEIARMLGLPTPFHAFRRLNATLASLRRLLKARGVESSSP